MIYIYKTNFFINFEKKVFLDKISLILKYDLIFIINKKKFFTI